MNTEELAELSADIRHTYRVTRQVYESFQACSGDLNPLHTDKAFAISKGFPCYVMYGNILNAFVSHFVGMLLPTSEVMILSQDISFHKPVFLGDEVELQAQADEVSEAVGLVGYKLKFRRTSTGELLAKGSVRIKLLTNKQ